MAELSRLPGPRIERWEWQLQAACAGAGTEKFFHPDGERGPARSAREAAAKLICAGCAVLRECAGHALAVREPYGVWGGMSEDDRAALLGRVGDGTRPAAAAGVA